MSRPLRPPPPPRSLVLTVLVAALAAGSLPMTAATAGDVGGADETAGQLPSIAYVEAMAHADDEIVFEPGGKVILGFTPRADDRWPVDGHAPSALPAGRATGDQMADSEQGTAWADLDGASEGPAAGGQPSPGTEPASPGPNASAAVPGHRRRPRRLALPDRCAIECPTGCPDRCPRGRSRKRRAPGSRDRRRVRRPGARARLRPRGRGRAQPPGLRLPAVLGAVGRLDQAQLRRAVHHRLLLRRCRLQGQPAQEEPRRDDHHRLGRLGQLVDDLRHQQRALARHARRAHAERLRLDQLAEDRPEGAPGLLHRAPQLREAGGRRRPRSRRRRDQPGLRTPGEHLLGRVRGAPADGSLGAQQGPLRLPAHVRHHRVHRQLPAGGLGQGRCRGRDLHHGLRLPDLRVHVRRVRGSAHGHRLRPDRHRPRLHEAGQPLPDHPGHPVVRPRLVHHVRRRPIAQPERREVRLQHRGQLRDPRGPRGQVRPPVGRRGAEPVHRLPARELHRTPTAA